MRAKSWIAAVAAVAAVSASGVAGARSAPRAAPTFAHVALAHGGGEPNVSISPSGRVVLADGLGGSPASLWRSTDYGRHFARIRPAFATAGGGDWDMRFLDERTVVAADLSDGPGEGILVHRSTDDGLTWTDTFIQTDVYDRPWIDHFGRDRVYVVAKGFDGVPYLYTSNDGGKSFGTPPVPVIVYGDGLVPAAAGGTSPTPVEALVSPQNAYVDHLVVDPKRGDVYVLYGIEGEDTYAHSQPAGAADRVYVAHLQNGSFVSKPVYIGNGTESFLSGFNWMTVDDAGTVYALLNGKVAGHYSTRLSYSKDRGATWSPLADLAPGGAANVYGAIAAGGRGMLSLVYLRGSNEDPSTSQDWYADLARVARADTPRPLVYRSRPVSKPIHQRDICFDGILCGAPGFGKDRTLLDYIWTAVAADGTAYAVVASDGPATGDHPSDCAGLTGDCAGVTPSVLLFRQSGGLKLGRGAPS